MRATGTFRVISFDPVDYTSPVETGVDVGHAHMVKEFDGDIIGRSFTQFSFAFDQDSGIGTYVAMEAFTGTLNGQAGAFAFAHSATTDGQRAERLAELFVVVPGSGVDELAGLTGQGRIEIGGDGTHNISLEYELGDRP